MPEIKNKADRVDVEINIRGGERKKKIKRKEGRCPR